MTSLAIAEAVYRRWNDAGLDEAVAALYFGSQRGSPEGTLLPRAQYSLPTDSESETSRSSRVRVQPVRFQLWAAIDAQVWQALRAIEEAYLNAESAASNPMLLAETDGRILGVDYIGATVLQESGDIFQGVLQLEVRWARDNSTPD